MRNAPWMTVSLCIATTASAGAQTQETCRLLCTPQLLVEPTVTIENLIHGARVITADGDQEQAERETVFEIILAVDIPTRLPRLGFTAEAILIPFAKTSANPFTGRSAEELGASDVRDNAVEIEFEVNTGLIRSEHTKGWLSSHFDIVDKFSPAERPGDRASYTHKLNFEWDTAVAAFRWLPERHWLRHVEVEGSLDYVATGLPKAGDEVHRERFLTGASPWSFSLVVVLPLTP